MKLHVCRCLQFTVGFFTALFLTSGCSTAPVLQSPRVTERGQFMSAVLMDHYRTHDASSDSSGKVKLPVQTGRDLISHIVPWYLRFHTTDRVEIGGAIMPSPTLALSGTANVKVFLFEAGELSLFRNVAMAVFSSGGMNWMVSEYDLWGCGGGVFATRLTRQSGEIELIVQPSVYRERVERSEHDPEITGFITGVQMNFGTIISIGTPGSETRFIFGGLMRKPLSGKCGVASTQKTSGWFRGTVPDDVILPLVWQIGIAKDFKKR